MKIVYVLSNMQSYLYFLIIGLKSGRFCLKSSEQSSTICIWAVNKNELSVFQLFQHFHPDVGLMRVWRKCPQKWNMDVLEKGKGNNYFITTHEIFLIYLVALIHYIEFLYLIWKCTISWANSNHRNMIKACRVGYRCWR